MARLAYVLSALRQNTGLIAQTTLGYHAVSGNAVTIDSGRKGLAYVALGGFTSRRLSPGLAQRLPFSFPPLTGPLWR